MEAKCVSDKDRTPQEMGLPLPHKIFVVFSYSGDIHDS